MKGTVTAAAVQIEPFPPADKERNVADVCARVADLAAEGVELAAFPELGLTNFFCEPGDLSAGRRDAWQVAESLDGPAVTAVAAATRKHGIHAVIGLAERGDVPGAIFNTAVLVGPGGIVGATRKVHAAGFEKLYYSGGTQPQVFDTSLGRIGMVICYDLWHPESVRCLGRLGAEIVVCINSAWKGGAKGGIGAPNKQRMFELVPVMRAFENGLFVVMCNGAGSHTLGDRYGTWERMGLSRIVDPHGTVLAESFTDAEDVVTARLQAAALEDSRAAWPLWADRRPEFFQALLL
ncbi:carbon-nitrogen hydrolase family protein [Baekduia soli]|uniref:Carbon-nitrogen hydrolase family protein n=1 Tax=Baekduia soli TaxID=496014 RepID=A0A5B8U052_9ACTN|nr:carbon-nitrogen hydrolase family protein [Baekduia soli]QEC46369.1 carbon-nitrogen hydrolase family protein [Baekduia soli]